MKLKIEETNTGENKRNENLFTERKKFILENYPTRQSHYSTDKLLNTGLDGMDILEQRDKNNEIKGILSYTINKDTEGTSYISIGIILTHKESREEGVMRNLISELKDIGIKNKCKYVTASVDTEEGEEFLFHRDFYEEQDPVNGRKYLRLDL